MKWKNLKNEPPGASCRILCQLVEEYYQSLFLARYSASERAWCQSSKYGADVTKPRTLCDTADNIFYINIDEIES